MLFSPKFLEVGVAGSYRDQGACGVGRVVLHKLRPVPEGQGVRGEHNQEDQTDPTAIR